MLEVIVSVCLPIVNGSLVASQTCLHVKGRCACLRGPQRARFCSGECATELVDSFWVRLDDGRWLEIRSDVVSVGYSSELTGPCDGCSTVWDGDTELGEICFDIAPLVWSTGSSPWPH